MCKSVVVVDVLVALLDFDDPHFVAVRQNMDLLIRPNFRLQVMYLSIWSKRFG